MAFGGKKQHPTFAGGRSRWFKYLFEKQAEAVGAATKEAKAFGEAATDLAQVHGIFVSPSDFTWHVEETTEESLDVPPKASKKQMREWIKGNCKFVGGKKKNRHLPPPAKSDNIWDFI